MRVPRNRLSPWARQVFFFFSAKTTLKKCGELRGTLGNAPSHRGNKSSLQRGHQSLASRHPHIPQNNKMHLNYYYIQSIMLNLFSRRPLGPSHRLPVRICFCPLLSLGLGFAALKFPRATHTLIYPISILLIFQNWIHISGFPLLSGQFFLFCLVLLCLLPWRSIILLGSYFPIFTLTLKAWPAFSKARQMLLNHDWHRLSSAKLYDTRIIN